MTDLSFLEAWFSRDRLTHYRTSASDNRSAVALYEWNVIDPIVSEQTRRDIREAIRRGTRNGGPETPGRVVAALNLGFWRFLLARRYDGTLWRYCLYRAFPGKRRADVERAVAELHVLRNRIGHHEPIHNRPLEGPARAGAGCRELDRPERPGLDRGRRPDTRPP